MMQRFTEAFGEVDVLLAPGDMVAHDIAPDHDDADLTSSWPQLQTYLTAAAELYAKNFPDTIVLTAFGNNDGYHNQAPDEDQKSTFFSWVHDLWFTNMPGNGAIVDSVKDTFLAAGYYRVDISDTISVLTFNFEYMDDDDDTSFQGSEADQQLDWLEQ